MLDIGPEKLMRCALRARGRLLEKHRRWDDRGRCSQHPEAVPHLKIWTAVKTKQKQWICLAVDSPRLRVR